MTFKQAAIADKTRARDHAYEFWTNLAAGDGAILVVRHRPGDWRCKRCPERNLGKIVNVIKHIVNKHGDVANANVQADRLFRADAGRSSATLNRQQRF